MRSLVAHAMKPLLVTLLLLTGCASEAAIARRPIPAADWPKIYSKDGVSSEQLRNDGLDCYWAKASGGQITMAVLFGPAAVAPLPEDHMACMSGKGYTVTR